MTASERLAQLGLELPAAPRPVAAYRTWVRHGELIYLAGHVCRHNGTIVTGSVGPGGDTTTGEAVALARSCALELLATIDAATGLDSVSQVVKLGGFVNATPAFTEHSTVLNGASELFTAVFGDAGLHARSAVGCSSLPGGAAVEVEAIVAVS